MANTGNRAPSLHLEETADYISLSHALNHPHSELQALSLRTPCAVNNPMEYQIWFDIMS